MALLLPISDKGILYRYNLVNKLSEDRILLGFTYLAYSYKYGVDKLINFWGYFLNFRLSYLNLSCSFMAASCLLTSTCSTI